MGSAQHATFSLPYTHYTVANGLAQMQVRSVFADHEGLVWVGTQGGLSVYDGNEMRTFRDLGPLSEKYIVSLMRGKGDLWITTHTGFFRFNGESVSSVPVNDVLPNSIALFEDPGGNVWVYHHETGLRLIRPSGINESIHHVYPSLGGITVQRAWGHPLWKKCYLLDTQNRFYVFDPADGSLRIDSTTLNARDQINIPGNTSAQLHSLVFQRIDVSRPRGFKTTDLFRVIDDRLHRIATRPVADQPLQITSPDAPLGYIESVVGEYSFFWLRDSVYRHDISLPLNSVRDGVWAHHKAFILTDEGLYIVHGDGIENVNFPSCDYAWSVVPDDDGRFFLGCYRTGVYHLSGEGQLLHHFRLPVDLPDKKPGDQILSNYLITPEATLWGSSSGFMVMQQSIPHLRYIPFYDSAGESFAFDPSTGVIVTGSDRLYWYDPNGFKRIDSMTLPEALVAGANVNDLAIDDHNHLWVAAAGGLLEVRLDDRSVRSFSVDDRTIPCRGGVTLDIDAAGTIWSGGTCGLMMRAAGQTHFTAVLPDIIRQRVNQVILLPDNQLVCASNNNLYVLDISSSPPRVIAVYNHTNGLNLHEPSENGISLSANRYVWLPSVSGIQRLDLQRCSTEEYAARVQVVRYNGQQVRYLDGLPDTLHTDGAAVVLDLSLIDHSGREWLYQLSLNGAPFTPWQSVKEILVTGLRHGYNHVRVRASCNTSRPSAAVETGVILKTHLPFLSRAGVQRMLIFLSALLSFLIVAAVIRMRRSQARADALRADLYRNRLRMIQAYLNPHFLFNTLTSIQDRILQQDTRTGNDMIVRLSRVFRKVLETGKLEDRHIPMIRLSEEIDLIRDMVYLNNQQLSQPVRFELDIPPEIEQTNPMVPPLLIQPFVENAFKHAFTEEIADKHIHVRIREEKGALHVSIQDNGQGYVAGHKNHEHVAMGTPLALERMAILNQLKIENHISVQPATPSGTRVTIQIKLLP